MLADLPPTRRTTQRHPHHSICHSQTPSQVIAPHTGNHITPHRPSCTSPPPPKRCAQIQVKTLIRTKIMEFHLTPTPPQGSGCESSEQNTMLLCNRHISTRSDIRLRCCITQHCQAIIAHFRHLELPICLCSEHCSAITAFRRRTACLHVQASTSGTGNNNQAILKQ